MSTMPDSPPIACLLPEEELAVREADLLRELFPAIQETRELPDGYAYRFPGDAEWVLKLAQFVVFERVCCPFFTFEMDFEPEQGPVWLHLRGPEGTKEFLEPLSPFPLTQAAPATGGVRRSEQMFQRSGGILPAQTWEGCQRRRTTC